MQSIRLFISIPSNRDWKGRFGASVANLVSHLTGNGIRGCKLEDFFLKAYGQASCLSSARQSFVDDMIRGGFTHWLSLDDDMTFPPDIVDRLIAHDKDVVAVNVRHKTQERIKGTLVAMDGSSLDSTGKTGLEEIGAMGGAIYLARIASFRLVPRPHFQVLWVASKQDYLDCDMHFAMLLRHHRVKMWCDHDTTQLIGHIGDHEYKFPEVSIKPRLVEAA